MRKSFTRLFSLVMFLMLFSSVVMAVDSGIDATKLWPTDGVKKAYTKTTDKIMITYPEAVKAGTGSVRVLDDADNVLGILPGNDSRISYTEGGTIVVIDLSSILKELTVYTVKIDGGTFKTVKDGTLSLSETLVFTTGDYTAPKLESVEPEKGTVLETDEGNDLLITFSDLSTVVLGKGTVSVYKEDGNLWDLIDVATRGAVAEVGGDYVLTLSDVRTLEDNTNYTVTIGAGVVTDAQGTTDELKVVGKRSDSKVNPYGGLTDRTVWTFSTVDFSAPSFATGYPKKSNVANDSFDVLVKANEAGTAYGLVLLATAGAPSAATIRTDANAIDVDVVGGTEATLSFDGLEEATNYIAYIIVDNADIEGTVVKPVEVTTSETDAPVLTSVWYNYSATSYETSNVTANIVDINADVDKELKTVLLNFNEEVKLGAGSIVIKKVLDNSVFKTIPSADMTISDDKMSVKFSLSGLANDVAYYAIIPGTLVLDEFDNKYVGISTVTGWRFTASDDIAPSYTIVPAHAAKNVKKDAKIVLTFDEVVKASELDFILRYGSPSVNITSSYDQNDNDGKYSVITLTPTAALPSSQLVQVIVYEGSIEDEAGNEVGDGQNASYSFFVEDHAGPVIKEWSDGIYDADADTWSYKLSSLTAAVQITYNEGIRLLGGTEITAANLPYILTVKKTNESGSNVAVNYAIDDAKKVISITPATKWDSEGTYYFAVSSDVEDMSGNEFVPTLGGTSGNQIYTVKDLIAETVAINVADKTISTDYTVDPITVKFLEGTTPEARTSYSNAGVWTPFTGALLTEMQNVIVLKEGSATGPNVYFEVGGTNGNFTVVNAALEGNKTYYIGVGPSTKDAAGNVNVTKFVTFTTKFETAPTKVSLLPLDNATQVAKGSNFVITFNTGVKLNSGYATGDVFFSVDGTTHTKDVISSEITFNTDGTVATINPGTDLGNDLAYDLIIGNTVFQNKNTPNVAFAGIAANAWDFVTTDTQIAVTSLNNDEANDVAIDGKLVLTFAEKIVVGSGNIDIKNFNTDAIAERINVTSANVVIDATDALTTITITPSSTFKYDTKYYVEVDLGAFKDVAGNSSKEIFGKTTANGVLDWVFTTEDVALAVTKITPLKESDKVGATAIIVVEFNRDIQAGTSGSVGYIEDDGTPSPKVNPIIGSSNLTISGNKLTIVHSDPFPADSKMWLHLDEGSITVKGDADNKIGLITNPSIWFFNTGDVNAPKPTFDPVAFVNADGKRVYVDVNKAITITFDEDIFHKIDGTVFTAGDITDDNVFELYKGATEVSFVGSISGRTVTMTPDVALDEFTKYTVVINDNAFHGTPSVGPDGVKDGKGHSLVATSIDFWTKDLSAPKVNFTLDGADTKLVISALTLVTPIDPNPSKFYYLVRVKSVGAAPSAAEVKAAKSVKFADWATTIEVKDLLASTTYEVFYVAEDTFGNTSAVAKKEASTLDTVAPLLVSTDPANNAVDVNVTETDAVNHLGEVVIKLNFNENVVVGTGAIVLREQVTETVYGTYSAATVLTAGADNKKLVLTLTGIPSKLGVKKFYVEMVAGSVKDAATIPFAGIFGTNGIYFSTEDNEKPTFSHDDSDHMIATNDHIKVKFSEAVKAGTGTAILYKGTVATPSAAVEVFSASAVTFSGQNVTINPTADLDNSSTYLLVVNASFALDMSTNKNANVAGQFTFDVSENVAPYVIGNYPSDNYAGAKVPKSSMSYIDTYFQDDVYFDIDGIRTNILLLTDAQIKANSIVTFVDATGKAVPFEMIQHNQRHVGFNVDLDLILHNSEYTLTIQKLTSVDGLVMTPYVLVIKTSDGIEPFAVFNPADETKDVNKNSALTITFNEQIYNDVIQPVVESDPLFYVPFTSANVDEVVYLYESDGDGGWEAVDFDATFDGVKVIKITPKDPLKSGVEYRFGYDDEEVVDADDQSVIGDYVAYFTVSDYVAPKFALTDVMPAKMETGVAANAEMTILFNEPIVVSTGSVIIRNLDGTIFQTIGATGLTIKTAEPNKLYIAHTNFASNSEYFVELQPSVVVDKSGNGNVAFGDPVDGWLFTTKDTYSIEAVVTPTGDNNQRVVNLEMSFNKVVEPNDAGDFGHYLTVYKEDGTAVKQIDAADLVVLNKKITYFNLELDANQAYYARIEPSAFVDLSGNEYAGIMDKSWAFSTIDNIAPKVTALLPADNATGVDAQTSSFTVTFDRNIALGTGMISVRYAVDGTLFEEVSASTAVVNGKTLTFNITKPLVAQTSFYVLVPAGAVTNTEVTKDAFAGIVNVYTWNFTTSTDMTAPKLLTWTPNATTITDNHPTLVMTFDEAVVLGAGNVKIVKKSDNVTALTIPITAAMVSDKTVTVTYVYDAATGGLDKNTDYYVLVDGGIVKDAAGNATAAVADVAAWTFKTGPDFATVIPVINDSQFKVYPNPFVDYVTVTNASELTKVVVSNIAGQVVKEVVNPENTIQLNELRSGVYFISLYQENAVIKTAKIVKR